MPLLENENSPKDFSAEEKLDYSDFFKKEGKETGGEGERKEEGEAGEEEEREREQGKRQEQGVKHPSPLAHLKRYWQDLEEKEKIELVIVAGILLFTFGILFFGLTHLNHPRKRVHSHPASEIFSPEEIKKYHLEE